MSENKKRFGGPQENAGRPKGQSHTGGKPLSHRCRNCGKLRNEWPVEGRSHSAAYCSDECEATRWESKRVELPCGYCGRVLSVPQSKAQAGVIYCNREAFLSVLHGKAMDGACQTMNKKFRVVEPKSQL